ncbi:hypothetical protein P691DRAFT_785722 [Macrolepiota fuliginosa MF-IS2]|uniref:BTB domain-containing protein n=1 Tax=Macrolepiota fuliginosa MF-IS2 TaxID=1400762 RepID=A0A9P5X829_9AGAR|nr:hypothetical protein P691DRAFT_785722 [Macrolepiota fuliginosa MF-IS2]
MTETQARRDPDFYFSFRTFQRVDSPSTNHIIKVEDTLFRVPRHLFLMPEANLQPVRQGTDNDDDLVVLGADIKKNDFLQLVRAIYPKQYNTPEKLGPEEWLAVLKLSEAFRLDDVRQKAARNLKENFFAGDPVKALLCAKENALDDWIDPLIKKIVEAKRSLTPEELNDVGIPLAMKIAWAQGAAGSPIPETPTSPAEVSASPSIGKKKRGKKRNE